MRTRRVGVIVPREEEFEYVREVFPPTGVKTVDGERYLDFELPSAAVTGVIRVLADMGQAPAALTADRMINQLGVTLVVVIGTGAGLDDDVRVGDVVVADQIQEHLRKGKVVPGADGDSIGFERAAESWRVNARLLEHVRHFGWLPSGQAALDRWRRGAADRWPPSGGDGPTAPHVHVGPLATGDVVVAASAFARWIRKANRTFVALDMEAGGAALAAYRNGSADLLVIRGISDHADEHKKQLDAGLGAQDAKNAWRRYAVRNAAEYLATLLASSGFPWRDTSRAVAGPAAPAATTRGSAAWQVAQLVAPAVSGVEAAMHVSGFMHDRFGHHDNAHGHGHGHEHGHGHGDGHEHAHGHGDGHEHGHGDGHEHEHGHEHDHGHDDQHAHDDHHGHEDHQTHDDHHGHDDPGHDHFGHDHGGAH